MSISSVASPCTAAIRDFTLAGGRQRDPAFTGGERKLCDLQVEPNRERIADILSAEVLNEHQEVDWEKVAKLANLDPGERIVLDLKLMGLSFREAIGACVTAEDRNILNTAWRRFDRHKHVVKQALLTGKPQHIMRKGSVPELELMFTEGEDGRLKIFFKKVVSKRLGDR